MPIILLWNETVEASLPQFLRWFGVFKWSNFLLEEWLRERVQEAEDLERWSMDFPVFRFYNEAVTARVANFQFGYLLTAPVEGVGDHVGRALEQWNVGRRVSRAVREPQLLPRFLGILEQITAGILASIDRFRVPSAEMFDPTQRSISDIPGIAVMAYRALATSRGQILDAAKIVRNAFFPASSSATSKVEIPEGEARAGETPSALPIEYRLDNIVRYLVAGLLLIPALARLLGDVGGDVLLHLRYLALDFFQGIEQRAYTFRRNILRVFIDDLGSYAIQGLELLYTFEEVANSYLHVYSKAAIEYTHGLLDGIRTFGSQLETFWSGVESMIHKVVRYGNAIIDIDVGPIIHRALVAVQEAIETIDTNLYAIGDSPEMYTAPREEPVTVGQLVMDIGPGAFFNQELREAVRLLHDAWYGAPAPLWNAAMVDVISGTNVPRTIAALQGLTGALALPRAGRMEQLTLTYDADRVPNYTRRIIQPLRRRIEGVVSDVMGGISSGIGGVMTTVGDTLSHTADAFDAAAVRASRLGSRRLLDRLVSDTDALMRSLFGRRATEASPTGFEPLAGTYAQWLVQGGFDMIGAAMAGFIGMVLNEWVEHIAEGTDTPTEVTMTSPRRLLKLARLGRVRAPKVEIVVRNWPPNPELAAHVADRFQSVVQEAYATGQANFDRIREANQVTGLP